MFRLPTELETLEAFELMEQARDEQRVVTVSYFRQRRDAAGKPLRFCGELPRVAAAYGDRPVLSGAPVTRRGEPVAVTWSREGNPYATVIMYRTGDLGIGQRTVRLDRISVAPSGLQLRLTRYPFTVAGTGLDPTVDRRPYT